MKRYTRRKIVKHLLIAFLICLNLLLVAVLEIFGIVFPPYNWILAVPSFLLLVIVARKQIIAAGNFIQGELGEDKVFRQLLKLTPEYKVFKNLRLGAEKGNIDFVVVGVRGVAVIEVKSHAGKIQYQEGRLVRHGKSSFEKDFIRQVQNQAIDIRRLIQKEAGLDLWVDPFIVFSDRFSKLRLGKKPLTGSNVIVVRTEWINNVILSETRGMKLRKDEVGRITEVLRKYCED